MPLPAIAGDDAAVMASPGMTNQVDQPTPPQGDVNPQDQVRGAVVQVSGLRTSAQQTLEALATQFPTVSKPARDLAQALDRGLQALVKELVKTVQTPEPQGPRVLR